MTLKFIILVATIAAVNGGVEYLAEKAIPQAVLTQAREDFDPHPHYKFAYEVEDAISGDSKRQVEERDGDFVQGEYSLNDADGFRRTVQYTADSVNGFTATIRREPLVKFSPSKLPALNTLPTLYPNGLALSFAHH